MKAIKLARSPFKKENLLLNLSSRLAGRGTIGMKHNKWDLSLKPLV